MIKPKMRRSVRRPEIFTQRGVRCLVFNVMVVEIFSPAKLWDVGSFVMTKPGKDFANLAILIMRARWVYKFPAPIDSRG
jgi:hypothetical protein